MVMEGKATNKLFDDDFLARLENLHLIARRMSKGSNAGQVKSQTVGDGLEFADHRAYSPGDDLRFVDWPCYARMEKLLLRLFHKHSESDVGLLLDISASMAPGGDFETFDYARRATAALAYVAMGSGSRVVLQPFDEKVHAPVRSGRDRSRIFPILDLLADLAPSGRTDLAGAAGDFDAHFPRAGWAILVSDLSDSVEALDDAMARMADHDRLVVVLHTYSPFDADPPLDGHLRLRHSETGREMNITVTDQLRELYRQRWQEVSERIRKAILRRRGVYIPAPTDLPFEELILQTLRRSGVLG